MITNFDLKMLKEALELSKKCTPSKGAYSVGAIIVDKEKNIISTGYSRETKNNVHAEEVAIAKATSLGKDLAQGTIYSTMEPCGQRLSGKKCCAQRIIDAGIKKVVYGIKEPEFFVREATGIQKLLEQNIEVVQIEEIIDDVLQVNKHICEG